MPNEDQEEIGLVTSPRLPSSRVLGRVVEALPAHFLDM